LIHACDICYERLPPALFFTKSGCIDTWWEGVILGVGVNTTQVYQSTSTFLEGANKTQVDQSTSAF
jgi:hypothetical protein